MSPPCRSFLRQTAFLAAVLATALATPAAEAADAPRASLGADYNISLLTDSSPDLTEVDRYLHSITSQYATPQEKAIAIWRWSQRLRKQMTNPIEGGNYVLDPIQMFNSFGYCNCGIISGVNDALWLKMGWKAHYVQLGDHTVTECSWDDGKTWHMFDSSMSFYCFNDQGAVASVREIEKNPHYYLQNGAPECMTNPAKDPKDTQAWRCASDHPVEFDRSLINGYDSFTHKPDIEDINLAAQWGHQYVLNMRPDESYIRYFSRAENDGLPGFRPVNGSKDVDINKNIRGNGIWRYTPNLRDPATRPFFYSDTGVTWTKDGIKGPGQVIFKVSAANFITGAKITVGGAGIALSMSRDAGNTWEKLSLDSGPVLCQEQIAGAVEYLVKADLADARAVLSSLDIETITQINRTSLPKLVRGANRIQVALGSQVDTIQFDPPVVAGKYEKSLYARKGLDTEAQPYFYKPTLRPAEAKTPCFATWKIDAPTPITDAVMSGTVCVKGPNNRVTFLHSWDDKDYVRDYEKTDGALPFDLMVNQPVTPVPAGSKTAYFRYEFFTQDYPKSYAGPGIQMAAMTVHHLPRTSNFAPLEVNYCWIEHRDTGDVERQHTELVNSPSHEYMINVGGFRDPTMKWVRVNLAGYGVKGAAEKYGYSDGQDAAPAAKRSWEKYTWGTNLALGKSYTLEGQQDDRNPDGGHDLTDGIVAPPDDYTSLKFMPTNVFFAKDVSPVATIDLGAARTVAVVRVQAGQDAGFHLTFPEKISVETSTDGKDFSPAGTAAFNQVFDPPADYVPWELDDAARFEELPAGGRLAYGYRILFEAPRSARYIRVKCEARKGWGMILSEIQAYDTVNVDKNVPPLVVLPEIAKK